MLVILIIVYAIIAKEALKQQRRIAALESTSESGHADFFRKMRTLKTFAIVVGVCVICYMPFLLTMIIMSTDPENTTSNPGLIIAFRIGSITMAVNSAANPVIYVLRMKSFKAALKNIIGCGTNDPDISLTIID